MPAVSTNQFEDILKIYIVDVRLCLNTPIKFQKLSKQLFHEKRK